MSNKIQRDEEYISDHLFILSEIWGANPSLSLRELVENFIIDKSVSDYSDDAFLNDLGEYYEEVNEGSEHTL